MNSKIKIQILRDPELLVFKYMWILVIIPKSLQLVLIAVFALLTLYKSKKIPKLNSGFLLMILVQIVAIGWQIIIGAADSERLMAAINTVSIWIFGVYFLAINKRYSHSDSYYDKLSKYLLLNMVILFILFVLSKVLSMSAIRFLGQALYLKRVDYMGGSLGSRFIGLMETPLASSHMLLFTLPLLSGYCIREKEKIKLTVLIVSLGLFATYATRSRAGTLMCAVSYFFFILLIMRKMGISKRIQRIFTIIMGLLAVIVLCSNYSVLIKTFADFYNSRTGSNEARFIVYMRSIEMAWNNSPFIGIGIKYMVDNFIPYGSHSTYIGIFYKTGIIGSIAFASGLWKEMRDIYINLKKSKYGFLTFIQIAAYLFFLLFADIDGINWVMVSVMSMWGIMSNPNYHHLSKSLDRL